MTDTLARATPSTLPADQRRRILDAAIACFVRAGFHGTSMQEICAEAKMSPGALYRYFPSKDAIIEAIAAEERDDNRRMMRGMAADGNVLENFFETGLACLREITEGHKGPLIAEVFAESQRNPRIRSIFRACNDEVHASMKLVLEKAQAQGEIDPGLDLDPIVTLLMSMFDGLVVRMPFQPELTPERIFPIMREMVQRMLAPRRETNQALEDAAS